jgi:hypothetical protein
MQEKTLSNSEDSSDGKKVAIFSIQSCCIASGDGGNLAQKPSGRLQQQQQFCLLAKVAALRQQQTIAEEASVAAAEGERKEVPTAKTD